MAGTKELLEQHAKDTGQLVQFMVKFARIEQLLNKSRVSENCKCRNCKKLDRVKICKFCGFEGEFAALKCECYDYSCGGRGNNSNGAGCFHGDLTCPVCDNLEGDVNAWDIIKEIRTILKTEVK